jgi:hypothetical protein
MPNSRKDNQSRSNDENPYTLAEAAKAKAITQAKERGDKDWFRAGLKAEDRALDAWFRGQR